jgi:hypothetical protein
VLVRARDPYGLTGEALARSAARLVAERPLKFGVLGPSEPFDPASTIESLADLGVTLAYF